MPWSRLAENAGERGKTFAEQMPSELLELAGWHFLTAAI